MNTKHIIWVLIGIFALWAILSAAILLLPLCGWEQRGQFGDMFGAVNALFAGLAFGGIIWTILQQRREMQLQRFEPLYLDLLRDIWEVQREIYHKDKKGYEAIRHLAKEMEPIIGATKIVQELSTTEAIAVKKDRVEEVDKLLEGKFPSHISVRNEFRPFLHAIKIVLRFLDSAPFSERERRGYAEWISGYFYPDEMFVIALLADDEIKGLIERYGLLSNMDKSMTENFRLMEWKETAFSARSETGG